MFDRNTSQPASWTVIASNVKDGTNYRLQFKGSDEFTGSRAD